MLGNIKFYGEIREGKETKPIDKNTKNGETKSKNLPKDDGSNNCGEEIDTSKYDDSSLKHEVISYKISI